MLEFVEVFVHNILACMVQKNLVDNTRHRLMINNLYNRIFVVYSYFVGKKGNFQSDIVRDVDSHGKSLNLLM